jgi:hypothetical protein
MVRIMQARFMLQRPEIYMLVALMNHDRENRWMVERVLSCESRLCRRDARFSKQDDPLHEGNQL